MFLFQILDGSNCVFDGADYCDGSTQNMLAHEFLLMHSKRNHDKFCLSYVFTKNNYEDGSLGLAWTASSRRGSIHIYLLVCMYYNEHRTRL